MLTSQSDVYGSFSWSTNIQGVKRWLLWPPEQTHLLRHRHRDELPSDPRDVDPIEFPWFASSTPIELVQQAGETIFVPSGWHHAVFNESRCLSINRALSLSELADRTDNWANAYCVVAIARNLAAEYDRTMAALQDVREMMERHDPASAARDFADAVDRTVTAQAGWKCVNSGLTS